MNFLEKTVEQLLQSGVDMTHLTIVTPNKRPGVFIRRLLEKKGYSGFLPAFTTITDLMASLSGKAGIQGASLWLFAYDVYRQVIAEPEDFNGFLKWFPTLAKDWDEMLLHHGEDADILEYLADEERIRNWSENLGEPEEGSARRRYMQFWRNAALFFPVLRKRLTDNDIFTTGMAQLEVQNRLKSGNLGIEGKYLFLGFNALNPAEEQLIRYLLKNGSGEILFDTDAYYMNDRRQEAGFFLRKYTHWPEFTSEKPFSFLADDFRAAKSISVYESPGSISQTKAIPQILKQMQNGTAEELLDTAIVLLDENLLAPLLEVLPDGLPVNITMGYPLKNLSFSTAVAQVFNIQKQLAKSKNSYYYADLLPILEEMEATPEDRQIIQQFRVQLETRNLIYIKFTHLEEMLGRLSYFALLRPAGNSQELLEEILAFAREVKFRLLTDVVYENVSAIENALGTIRNQVENIGFALSFDALEFLMNQILQTHNITFEGEPLEGLQVMGLLETRLLDFRRIILLSANEGIMPAPASQNTFVPFDVRRQYGLPTYHENDSIYAYQFYRLLQSSEEIHILYSGVSGDGSSGEKSRFLTQLEYEDAHHSINHWLVESSGKIVQQNLMEVPKTPVVMERLAEWQQRISVSSLTNYAYNPINFYFQTVLKTRESGEISEELSIRDYGNLMHKLLESIYKPLLGKVLQEQDLQWTEEKISQETEKVIEAMNHQPEYYARGLNYLHRQMAERTASEVLRYDLNLVKDGHELIIHDLEHHFKEVPYTLPESGREVKFHGIIDRIDELDGQLRIIDYKTGKSKDSSNIPTDSEKLTMFFFNYQNRQALQLYLYRYVLEQSDHWKNREMATGIWSFAEVRRGVQDFVAERGQLASALEGIAAVIEEILNPAIPFVEKEQPSY